MSESTHIDVRTDDESQDDEKTKGKNIYTHKSYGPEHVILIVNFLLELLSAAFDQISSVHKPQFALLSMLMSFLVFIICAADCAKKISKSKGKFVISNPGNFGFVSDTVGLICAFFQCVFSSIAYAFLSHHANNPIKINVWPIVFAFILLFSKLPRRRRRSRKSTAKGEPGSETASILRSREIAGCGAIGLLARSASTFLEAGEWNPAYVAVPREDDESTSSNMVNNLPVLSDDGTELEGMNLSIYNHNNGSHKIEFEQLGISDKDAGGEPNFRKLRTCKSATDIRFLRLN